ncbi:Nucleotidylyl transferase [Glarea lozoyensis ATCC 20868]|uniref:glutamate--tRNA ligase n=1 Tax=Glarea lozoyensis (strain ATCC 20868 / MF5171) TaxID=1116229 RepID=S3EES0_GLAL2|nr:Nucleotidylyl transferase [Glarea lozoyensis ATCC 20868]EPE36713.1 Nucleotidylyl transferase [Glarea lozoyensis ATCC 20868]
MAHFDVARKANLALVLPSLLTAVHLHREQPSLLPYVTKTFHDGNTLSDTESIRMTCSDGETFAGKFIVGYLAKVANNNQILQWIARSKRFLASDYKSLQESIFELNIHLTLRSFLVGHATSIADIAFWATIRGNRVAHSLIQQQPVQENALRWYTYIEETNPWLSETVAELTSFDSKARAAASAAGASYEIDLPNLNRPMTTRFPPEPSGYLHIGHAKAALLNDYFAHKSSGTLICRFDDTNPSKEKMEFQDAILEDLGLMEIVPDKISYSSDYFQVMYEFALKLIQDGKAFADDSELGKGDEDRKIRLPSKRRDLSIEETLKYFTEMKAGSKEGLRWCIRARIAYDSPNGTLRDPVIYRCNPIPHHRTGTQWKIYPTYDFCAPILDSYEGVTVALRTNEYRDRNVQYEWMQDALGLRKVTIWDFSRMNFIRTVLSKRRLTRIVDDGKVWGWDDPRMPTIRGIIRRGMTVPALREFILKQGPSRNILNLEWGALWALNKKYTDHDAARHTAIVQADAVTCRVLGVDDQNIISKPKYIKNLELGTKKVVQNKAVLLEQIDAQGLEEGEEITLMNWGNAYVRRIVRDESGQKSVTEINLELHLEGDVKKTKKLSWLAAVESNLVPVDIVSFDYLITKDKLEKTDKLENFLASNTELRTQAFADCNVKELAKGAIIQFERKGYYKLDVAYGEGERMVFFDIPSGKT